MCNELPTNLEIIANAFICKNYLMNKGQSEISILINLTIDSEDETIVTFLSLIKIELSFAKDDKCIPIFV